MDESEEAAKGMREHFFYPNSSYISGNSADYKCAYL